MPICVRTCAVVSVNLLSCLIKGAHEGLPGAREHRLRKRGRGDGFAPGLELLYYYYCTNILLYYCATVLPLYSCNILLFYYFPILLVYVTTIPLYYYYTSTILLLLHYSTYLRFYYSTLILFYYTNTLPWLEAIRASHPACVGAAEFLAALRKYKGGPGGWRGAAHLGAAALPCFTIL